MTEQTPEPTSLTHADSIGADLHERGSLDFVLDDALRHAVLTGTGWIRIRYRAAAGARHPEDLENLAIGDWTLDAPNPANLVEVVTVVAGADPDTHFGTDSPDTTQETP